MKPITRLTLLTGAFVFAFLFIKSIYTVAAGLGYMGDLKEANATVFSKPAGQRSEIEVQIEGEKPIILLVRPEYLDKVNLGDTILVRYLKKPWKVAFTKSGDAKVSYSIFKTALSFILTTLLLFLGCLPIKRNTLRSTI